MESSMLVLSVLLTAIFVGMVRRGRLPALAEHPWRAPLLPFLAVGIQVLAFLPDESASAAARTSAAWLHGASYVLLLLFAWANRSTPWMSFIGIGILANTVVIVANRGFMPVWRGAPGQANAEAAARGVANNVAVIQGDTALWFLGDIFQTPAWLSFGTAFSLGDLAIAVGAFLLVQHLMCGSPGVPRGGVT